MSQLAAPRSVVLFRLGKARRLLQEAGFEVAEPQLTRPPRERGLPVELDQARVVRQQNQGNTIHLAVCPMD